MQITNILSGYGYSNEVVCPEGTRKEVVGGDSRNCQPIVVDGKEIYPPCAAPKKFVSCIPINDCPDGQVRKEIQGGIDKYGYEIKTEFRCVPPTSALDCPPNTTFYNPIGGIKRIPKCIPVENPVKGNPKDCEVEWIKELKYREKVGPTIKLAKPWETKEEFMARCKGTATPVDPIKPIVQALKPKTEEEEYRNFIFLTMAAVGVYLILSE